MSDEMNAQCQHPAATSGRSRALPARALPARALPARALPARALPECCNSGCTVCVLDYPELFLTPDDEMLALLDALEQAEQTATCLSAGGDSIEEQGE